MADGHVGCDAWAVKTVSFGVAVSAKAHAASIAVIAIALVDAVVRGFIAPFSCARSTAQCVSVMPACDTTASSEGEKRVLRGKTALRCGFRAVLFAPQGACEK